MRGILDPSSLAAIKATAAGTFDVARFVRRVKSKGSGEFSTKKTFADGATFSGRLKVLDPAEVPAEFAGDQRQKARLTSPADAIELASADRVKDTFDGAEFEVIAELGTRSSGAIVWEWLVAKVS